MIWFCWIRAKPLATAAWVASPEELPPEYLKVADSEGVNEVMALEQARGFEAAQAQVQDYLSDPDWQPLPHLQAWLEGHLASPLFEVAMVRLSPWRPGDAPVLFSGGAQDA